MTNSKKIKRNIGASRRLAPFGHVRSITFTIMLLTVALIFGCRKSGGGGGTTQTDPIKNLTGNLLIVSADGTRGANSLPLSFVGASATVSDVKVDKFGGQGGDILLFPTNFIIENGNLYLTNLTTTNKDGGEVKAAVSNKVTLTFSLSGENLSKYTDTAEIYVGKYSNISTNILDIFKKFTTMESDTLSETTDTAHPIKNLTFEFTKMTNATTNSSFLLLENTKEGDGGMIVNGARFVTNLNKSITAQKTSFDTYFTDVKVNGFNTNDSESIANFQIDFSGKKSYLYYYEGEPNYHLIFFLKQGKWDNNLGK